MKGLLIKDLWIAKSNILVTLISLLVIGFGISFLMESSTILVLAPAISTTAVFISITSDATSKWHKTVLTMPVSRKQIIAEKYLMYLILSMIGILVALIPCGILAFIKHDVTVNTLMLYTMIGIDISFLAGSISLLCAYLFDPEKSQIVFMMSYLGATGMMTALILLLNVFMPVKDYMILSFGILLLFSLLLFFISYKLAARIYERIDIC